jgi:hypothetical protein
MKDLLEWLKQSEIELKDIITVIEKLEEDLKK